MFRIWFTGALLTALAVPSAVNGQTPKDVTSAVDVALACAPTPLGSAATALRIAGSDDVVPRGVFGPRDLLVINGGSAAGVAVSQRYFVRRTVSMGGGAAMYAGPSQRLAQTVGWISIVSVNDTTALATIDHACGVLTAGDYLTPFVAPSIPADALRPVALRDLDFSAPGHIMFGDDEHSSVAVGEFAVIDRGTSASMTVGSHLAIYRDVRVAAVPLASVGQAVVVSTTPDTSVVRIVRARDAVFSGDYVVPEKK
jgi:hypothetical protein